MKKSNKKRGLVLSLFLSLILILLISQNIQYSQAQLQYDNNEKTLTVPLQFLMYEFSENTESKENITSIDISLPSSAWNLTDIQINFTDIDFNREIRDIETEETTSYRVIDKSTYSGHAIQINLTQNTTIYGVQIFGKAYNPVVDQVKVQIQGYDSIFNIPDGNVLREVSLNISTGDPKWYTQTFLSSINLIKGNYSLVLYTAQLLSKSTEYWWYYNRDNPKYPNLYTSSYDAGWSVGVNETPFLYKLDQKLNYTFEPKDINMTAEINGNPYPVSNSIDPIKGELSIPNVNYYSNTDTLPITINNNKSSSLLFNATYNYNLKNNLLAGGTVSIKESLNNTWNVNPIFTRTPNNDSIRFDYPANWFNLTVFNSTGELSKSIDYIDVDNAIYIPNNTITSTTGWKITANSEKVEDLSAVPQLFQYKPLQTVIIDVITPSLGGNLTFILLDKLGNLVYNDTIEYSSGTEQFSYTLPQNPFEGTWQALIYWNNETDAGLEINDLTIIGSGDSGGGGGGGGITVVTGIDPQLIFMVILYVAIASIAGLTSYKMVKRHKKNKAAHREEVFNKYMDLLNLDYIMIIDKKSGLSVYDQILAGKERDSSLISGFLEAIRTFGIDLTGSEEESQTISLQYQNMNIIMNDFKNFRILNIMKESPSQDFLDSLRPLSHDIDTFYGKSLKDFDGNIAKFKGIKDLLETHLHTSLIYPLKVVKSKEIKLNSAEKSLTNKAQSLMKKNKSDYFYVSHLMGTSKEFNVKNAEIILKLIEKTVFRPIE